MNFNCHQITPPSLPTCIQNHKYLAATLPQPATPNHIATQWFKYWRVAYRIIAIANHLRPRTRERYVAFNSHIGYLLPEEIDLFWASLRWARNMSHSDCLEPESISKKRWSILTVSRKRWKQPYYSVTTRVQHGITTYLYDSSPDWIVF